jgi:long-chain acyl-CoA synthetase
MYLSSTIVGFYDSMGDSSVEFILNQTELTTIFCSAAYLSKITNLKAHGMAKHVKNVVLFDSNPKAADKTAAEANGIVIHSYEEVIAIGKNVPGEIEAAVEGVIDFIFGSSKPRPA